MTEVFMYIFVGIVLVASGVCWWNASSDCSARHGVLIKDAAGLPACVPEAPR